MRPQRRKQLASALLLAPGMTFLAGSSELYRVDGTGGGSEFGHVLAMAGDVDQDGLLDFIVGAPAGGGRAAVHSGVDGQQVWQWFGSSSDRLGSGVAGAGDVDGDAIADLLVGAAGADEPMAGRPAGAASLYSGFDGAHLFTWYGMYTDEEFGASVASLGDIDGDGVSDQLVGAPGASYLQADGGAAYLFSGATGASIDRVNGAVAGNMLGAAVAALGDVDHDGYGDFAVGLPFRLVNGNADAGAVWVYSGATRKRLYTVAGDQAGLELGHVIAGGGDANADGTPDFAVGAPKWTGTFSEQGVVRVCSGVNGSVLWERFGTAANDRLGCAVALMDGDGNGEVEVLVTAGGPGTARNRVERCSGPIGTLLYAWRAEQDDDGFGESLAILGDVNVDGLSDFAMGVPRGDDGSLTFPGSVHVHRSSAIWLNADPKAVASGSTLTTTIRSGYPGYAALRFAVDLNGTPLFLSLPPLSYFDSNGSIAFAEPIPPGLSGLAVTLRAYAIATFGKLIATNDEVVAFL